MTVIESAVLKFGYTHTRACVCTWVSLVKINLVINWFWEFCALYIFKNFENIYQLLDDDDIFKKCKKKIQIFQ